MRVCFIGDVHGHDEWHEPMADALARGLNVVFIGDYLDSFTVDGVSIYDNLSDILEMKRKYPDRITLLLGNHEYVYMMNKIATTTGGNSALAHDYYLLLNSNWDLFDLAWGYQGEHEYYLATHAGLTNEYYKKFILPEINNLNTSIGQLASDNVVLHKMLNFFKDKFSILWQVGTRTEFPTGPGSIIWADRIELLKDPFKNINQIVGHTALYSIDIQTVNKNNLYFINLKENIRVGALTLNLT